MRKIHLLILFFSVPFISSAQYNPALINSLKEVLQDELRCKHVYEEYNFSSSYNFITSQDTLEIFGDEIFNEFTFKKKSKAKKLNRPKALEKIVQKLLLLDFKKIYSNEEQTLLTFKFNPFLLSKVYLEIFIPKDGSKSIELIFFEELNREEFDKGRVSKIKEKRSLLERYKEDIDLSCKAKCSIARYKIRRSKDFLIYTGDNSNDITVKSILIEIEPKSTQWYKKIDTDCFSLSRDSALCSIQCLRTLPEKKQIINVVIDTINNKNFEKKSIEYFRHSMPPPELRSQLMPVICESSITKEIIFDIQTSLKSDGLYTGKLNGEYNSETREAILEFQKKHHLPIGHLNEQTLSKL